jgi:hypothetical protein
MIVDRAGNIWLGHPGLGSGGGASRYDGKSFKHFTQNDGLNSTNVYCMLEDTAGNIWFGSVDAGACRYDGKTFTNFSATEAPSSPAKPATAATFGLAQTNQERISSTVRHLRNSHRDSRNHRGPLRMLEDQMPPPRGH